MGWLDAIFKRVTRGTRWASMLNGYTPIFSQFGEDIYASDVVQQAIRCIVDEMTKLTPVHIREEGDDPIPINDSIQRVLNAPNQLMTKSAFIEKITWALMLHYNAFVIPVYDVWTDEKGNERRNYRALYPVQPTTVTFLEDSFGQIFIRMRFANNYETELPYSDVIHLRRNYSVNEFMGGDENGLPDHSALLKTLTINHNLLEGVNAAVKTSFSINGVVKVNTMLDKGKTEAALKEFEEKVKNSESGFLPVDLKSEIIPFKKDIKLVDKDTLEFIDKKILRNFGVPLPILTGDFTKQQYEAFYQKTLETLIVAWSEEFTRVLFTQRQRSFNHKVVFYPKKLIFLSTEQTIEVTRLLGDSGSLYENEKRTAFGLRPLPELVGIRMQSLNYVNVEYAKEYQTQGQTSDDKGGKKDEQTEETEDE